jgi:hypothetical protein
MVLGEPRQCQPCMEETEEGGCKGEEAAGKPEETGPCDLMHGEILQHRILSNDRVRGGHNVRKRASSKLIFAHEVPNQILPPQHTPVHCLSLCVSSDITSKRNPK